MGKMMTRQQAVLQERVEDARKDYRTSLASTSCEECDDYFDQVFPTPPAETFVRCICVPHDPIPCPLGHGPECVRCCCGCDSMPNELWGGMCLHCGHNYQLNDPEMWEDESFPHSEAAHLKACVNYQKCQARCVEKERAERRDLIAEYYDAFMNAPEGSDEQDHAERVMYYALFGEPMPDDNRRLIHYGCGRKQTERHLGTWIWRFLFVIL